MPRLFAACFALCLAAAPLRAEEVDLELVLLADASGSIDDTEIRLQRAGYADALRDEQVLWAIANGGRHGRIAVAYVEWATVNSQDVVVDWTVIDDDASAAAFGEALMAAPRNTFGSNAIGAALLKGLEMLETNAFDGSRRVLDLSADSLWNPAGPTIAAARDAVLGAGVVINGLAVLCRSCSGRPRPGNLEAEFADQVIGGLGAFVVTAGDDDTSFEHAVRRKLILEIADLARTPPLRR
jgi:adhesin HecA-like repeat protein